MLEQRLGSLEKVSDALYVWLENKANHKDIGSARRSHVGRSVVTHFATRRRAAFVSCHVMYTQASGSERHVSYQGQALVSPGIVH